LDKKYGQKTLVLATHGLIKKTGKTPQADFDKAEKIRQKYLAQKK
jgi:phage-related protein